MKRGRRGIALPLALISLVLIAGLVAAGFTVALLEQRLGRNAMYGVQAAAAADAGIAAVVGGWPGAGLVLLAPGDSAVLPAGALPGRTRYVPAVVRLNGQLFLLRVEGTRSDAGGGVLARREVGLLLRIADSAVGGPAGVRPLRDRPWLLPGP